MAWQDREREYKNLREVQQLLGEISMTWAAIDRWVDRILTDMLDLSHGELAAIVTGMRVSTKCDIVRRLTVLDCPSEEWRQKMDAAMTEIGQSLGPTRNRLVHDGWDFTEGKIEQVDASARLEKRPFAGKVLSFDTRRSVEIEDLKQWCASGFTVLTDLRELRPALLPWLLQRRDQLSQ